jgi:hypothetical protein
MTQWLVRILLFSEVQCTSIHQIIFTIDLPTHEILKPRLNQKRRNIQEIRIKYIDNKKGSKFLNEKNTIPL